MQLTLSHFSFTIWTSHIHVISFMRLVSVINREDMSLSGYIDHVLTEHFQKYGEVIKEVYKKNNKDIIMW